MEGIPDRYCQPRLSAGWKHQSMTLGLRPADWLRRLRGRGGGDPQVPPSGEECQSVEQGHEDEEPPVPDDSADGNVEIRFKHPE